MDEIKDKYRREWEALEKEETALAQEKKKLSDEWVSIEKQQQLYEKDRAAFEKQVAAKLEFLSPDTVVHFNIGGKLFKSTVSVWARDRFSILAQLCTTQPKLGTDGRGHYFFDRDWLVFKFIYAFLRDKTLPESIDTLRDLYYEASFYRITLLRHAIEAYLKSYSSVAQVHAGYATDPSLATVRENDWSAHGRRDGKQNDRRHADDGHRHAETAPRREKPRPGDGGRREIMSSHDDRERQRAAARPMDAHGGPRSGNSSHAPLALQYRTARHGHMTYDPALDFLHDQHRSHDGSNDRRAHPDDGRRGYARYASAHYDDVPSDRRDAAPSSRYDHSPERHRHAYERAEHDADWQRPPMPIPMSPPLGDPHGFLSSRRTDSVAPVNLRP